MLSSLAKKNEPVEMFRLAEMHLRAAGIISRKKLKNNNLSNNPAHVLLAFSLELYLKCLITLEGHLPRHIHQGHKLFSQLNGKTQNRLRSDFQTICKFDYAIYKDVLTQKGKAHLFPHTIDQALKQSDTAFDDFRYLYQDPSRGLWTASPAVDAVRELLLNRCPSWKRHSAKRRNK